MVVINSEYEDLTNGVVKSKFSDEKIAAFEPLLARGYGTSAEDERNSVDPEIGESDREVTIGEEVEHVAAETYLVTRLGVKLLGYLGY